MFIHTTYIRPLPNFRLDVAFNNGVQGTVSLVDELWGEVFEPLRDPELFATAQQSESMRTVVWGNGADLAPEFLLQLLQQQSATAAAAQA